MTRRSRARPTGSLQVQEAALSDRAKPAQERRRSFRAYYALAALVVGLVAGMLRRRARPGRARDALAVAWFVGTLWLNALKMTVIPLVVALLVVGIAKSAEAAQAGRIAGRSVLWIVIICTGFGGFRSHRDGGSDPGFPACARNGRSCFKERSARSSKGRAVRFRGRRVLQGCRPAQCRRRREQWRHSAAHRLRRPVRPGADPHRRRWAPRCRRFLRRDCAKPCW